MSNDPSAEACYVLIDHVQDVQRQVRRRRRRFGPVDEVVDPWSYQAKRGQATLQLTTVEYRILNFLAARPNQAFTPGRIADAVSTVSHRVTVETLGGFIHSLRGHLGFFSDYIQTVPYIGYRFKA